MPGYLKLLLEAKVVLRGGHLKARYRVIMPVDFDDGVTHQPGEIMELDLDTAIKYALALQTTEEDVAEPDRKKLA